MDFRSSKMLLVSRFKPKLYGLATKITLWIGTLAAQSCGYSLNDRLPIRFAARRGG